MQGKRASIRENVYRWDGLKHMRPNNDKRLSHKFERNINKKIVFNELLELEHEKKDKLFGYVCWIEGDDFVESPIEWDIY